MCTILIASYYFTRMMSLPNSHEFLTFRVTSRRTDAFIFSFVKHFRSIFSRNIFLCDIHQGVGQAELQSVIAFPHSRGHLHNFSNIS